MAHLIQHEGEPSPARVERHLMWIQAKWTTINVWHRFLNMEGGPLNANRSNVRSHKKRGPAHLLARTSHCPRHWYAKIDIKTWLKLHSSHLSGPNRPGIESPFTTASERSRTCAGAAPIGWAWCIECTAIDLCVLWASISIFQEPY